MEIKNQSKRELFIKQVLEQLKEVSLKNIDNDNEEMILMFDDLEDFEVHLVFRSFKERLRFNKVFNQLD